MLASVDMKVSDFADKKERKVASVGSPRATVIAGGIRLYNVTSSSAMRMASMRTSPSPSVVSTPLPPKPD